MNPGTALCNALEPSRTVSAHSENRCQEGPQRPSEGAEILPTLERLAGVQAAADQRELLEQQGPLEVCASEAALLIIDPQRSFTDGAWMRSIGPTGSAEVEPIRLAFEACARWLAACYGRFEVVFTRCPFPPDSYEWHERIAALVHTSQPYFVKPGNSVLWPPTNGFTSWLDRAIDRGKSTLVIAGCTLNSCVRVSAIEIQLAFERKGLQVAVDLARAGARTGNYTRSPMFGGVSSVQAAVREMTRHGVRVVARVDWRA